MQTRKIEAIKLLSLVVALALGAYWWGELGAAFDILLAIPASVVAGIGVVLLMKYLPSQLGLRIVNRWWQYSLLALGLAAVLFASFQWGYNHHNAALNACNDEGEQVRTALEQYHQQHQAYPANLDALNISTPCNRLMHPGLLHYQRTETGYALRYNDWLTHYSATESNGFDAHK
jgi:hypothetical protein